jgi:hypothetical protein
VMWFCGPGAGTRGLLPVYRRAPQVQVGRAGRWRGPTLVVLWVAVGCSAGAVPCPGWALTAVGLCSGEGPVACRAVPCSPRDWCGGWAIVTSGCVGAGGWRPPGGGLVEGGLVPELACGSAADLRFAPAVFYCVYRYTSLSTGSTNRCRSSSVHAPAGRRYGQFVLCRDRRQRDALVRAVVQRGWSFGMHKRGSTGVGPGAHPLTDH